MSDNILIEAIENNRICSSVVSDIACTNDSVNHLEVILINKIKYRKEELKALMLNYDNAIQSYSSVILKLLPVQKM